ncbi:hypothetical protein NX794_08570 [Streptomyces sp. LP11]|uniref:Uncharacterized protein n=1 Tax=Streptomyces pyxinicus TaxID=2970331 RepID=A0ABT2AYF1_9ACTN|nr:hypothetical protein [Streptomyces sp. LP11]MCS0601283.1 hypothetical protein [Streptomyces sp. LP11]
MTAKDRPAPAVREFTGTAGHDLLTVHLLKDGQPKCEAPGKVDEWQRTANCPACLTSK